MAEKLKTFKNFQISDKVKPSNVDKEAADEFDADEMEGITAVGPLEGDEDAEKQFKNNSK